MKQVQGKKQSSNLHNLPVAAAMNYQPFFHKKNALCSMQKALNMLKN
jgi:hypothetical protein